MNWTQIPAQARAIHFVELVTPDTVDDDLNAGVSTDWPPLLDRRQAAQYLDIGMKWLSDISGEGPHGGRLQKYKVRGIVFWRLEDLQDYDRRRKLGQQKERGGGGRWQNSQ